MKRQYYFDHVERDLLICALEFWNARLGDEAKYAAYAKAGEFTKHRISELLARLRDPVVGSAA